MESERDTEPDLLKEQRESRSDSITPRRIDNDPLTTNDTAAPLRNLSEEEHRSSVAEIRFHFAVKELRERLKLLDAAGTLLEDCAEVDAKYGQALQKVAIYPF